jgi:hypothetical protein
MEGSSREPDQQRIEALVRQIRRRRLALPALLLLEIARPFSFLLSQGLLLLQPLLGYLLEEPLIADYAELLADRGNMDRLVTRLEETHSHTANGGGGRG